MLKKPKNKSKERKRLVRELDRIFSLLIRKRDGYQCVLCGRSNTGGGIIQCGHLFSRVAYSTRWDEENAFAQCAGCNSLHEYDSYPYIDWFIKKYGKDKLDEIHLRYNKPSNFSNSELEEMLNKLKKRLDEV